MTTKGKTDLLEAEEEEEVEEEEEGEGEEVVEEMDLRMLSMMMEEGEEVAEETDM